MFFRKKTQLPTIQLFHANQLLFDGFLKDIPLKESVILEKSIVFFDDPEPCHIHRGAVRTRLTAEIQRELENSSDSSVPGPLLKQYINFDVIDTCKFTA